MRSRPHQPFSWRGIEQKQIGQPLLGDEPFKIAHVTVRNARGASAHHVEAGDFTGRTVLADLEQLPDADRQRKTLAPRGVLQAPVKLISIQRNGFPHMQSQPAGRHGQTFRVVLGEVRETDFHAGVIQPNGLAIASDDAAARRPTGRRCERRG